MDGNADFDKIDGYISDTQRTCDFADPIKLHQNKKHITTYKQGSICIDGILISPGIVYAIHGCRYMQYDSLMISYHREIWIDLNEAVLFGKSCDDNICTINRVLTLGNPEKQNVQNGDSERVRKTQDK